MEDTTPGDGDSVGLDSDLVAARARDAEWVQAALDGDQRAFGRLYDAWFDRAYNVSLRVVRDPEVAAEVTQDAFLSAWKNLASLENKQAFGGWLLRIARNGSFNRSTKERRSQAVDDGGLAVIESTGASSVAAPAGFGVEDRLGRMDDPARAVEDSEVVALVHEAAGALGARDAEVLHLQLRDGLTPAEVGEVLGMNRNAANQLCHRIRQRFATAVSARVLWRGSRPACDELDALLRSAGLDKFDAEAVKVADRHAASCEQCSERRELKLQPAALFASVPIVAAPVLFKQQAAGALEAAGVPMDGSSSASAGVSSGGDAGAAHGDGPPDAPFDDDGPDGRDGPNDADAARNHGRGRRIALMAGAAAAVFVLALLALASRVDEGTVDEELAVVDSEIVASTTSATTPATTATPTSIAVEAPPDTPPADLAPPASDPGDTTSPTVAPVDPTPPPEVEVPAPVIGFSLRPAQAGQAYNVTASTVPTLTWAVEGAMSVRVEGHADNQPSLLSSSVSGSTRVCPGIVTTFSYCESQPGVYSYEIIVEGQDGRSYRQAATLTIA